MDVKFVWVFVFSFCSKIILVTPNYDTRIGQLRVLRRYRGISKCGNEILHHDEYVGGRISHLTGDCEGLSHSWGRNQTIETGYGYVKKAYVQKSFEPQVQFPLGSRDAWTTGIPGIMNTGARIDLHLTGQIEGSFNTFVIQLTEASKSEEVSGRARFIMRIGDTGNMVYLGDSSFTQVGFPAAFYDSTEWKISFVAQNRSLQVLLDDEVLETINLKNVRLNYLKQVTAYRQFNYIEQDLFIRRFEFSEA